MAEYNESYILKGLNGKYENLEEALKIKSVNSDNAVQCLMPGQCASGEPALKKRVYWAQGILESII